MKDEQKTRQVRPSSVHPSSFILHPSFPEPPMTRTLAAFLLIALFGRATAAEKFTLKVEDAPPPKELSEPVRALLGSKAMTVVDEKGKVLCTVWARKALETKATADQAKAGLTYAHLEETTIVGAVKFPDTWVDFRKQKTKPGVYTLRLGIQPMDGDHMGTAPYNEFCLLCAADKDTKPDALEPMALHELSAKSGGRKHPSVMLLFPNPKPADAPTLAAKPNDTWVLNFGTPATAAGQKSALGLGVVVFGVTMAE
jgi:hypothetical protein